MKTIYYLEDDWRYATAVISDLEARSVRQRLDWKLQRIPTESEFLEAFRRIIAGDLPRPSAFILDVMVRFATPRKEDSADDYDLPPYDRAGIRAAERILRELPKVPIIIYTILDETDLPPEILVPGVYYVAKEPNTDRLFNVLKNKVLD